MINKWKQLRHKKSVRYTITTLAVILSAIMQAYVIQVFIRPAGILSGGFTGVAILIDRITSLYGISISTSLAMILLNLPVAFLCSRSINLKFTVFSLLQVFLTSFLLNLIDFEPVFTDEVLNVMFGGVLNGASILIALRGNASTGGTDFIALYVSNKTGKSIWSYVFAGNVMILILFGYLFGWKYAGYSIILQFISTRVVTTFHNRYKRMTLLITTTRAEELMNAYIEHFRHGISCIEAIGGYSHKPMHLLHTVVSSYEINDILHVLTSVDENVIINMVKTEDFYGRFYRAPLD